MKKQEFIIFLVALTGLAFFLIVHYQTTTWQQVASEINNNNNETLKSQITTSTLPHASSTEEELAFLRQEVETLRNQPAKIIYRTIMTPASPSPAPDLNTQAALAKAQEQINSLQQQLANLQAQAQPTPTAASEAQLIQSWQADQKVAEIACENKTLGGWQLGSAVLISWTVRF